MENEGNIRIKKTQTVYLSAPNKIHYIVYFYIQSFSLTECIVIAGVRKIGIVYVSVCLCLCLRRYSETTGPISTKLTQMGPLYAGFACL